MRVKRACCLLLLIADAGCSHPAQRSPDTDETLRIAISRGRMSVSAPDVGLAQVKLNLSLESLANFTDDGRPRPAVAEGWAVSDDRRTVTLRLRPNVQFQDGTAVTSEVITNVLKNALPRSMGPAFVDVETVRSKNNREVEIRFARPSGFHLEVLEAAIQKPGSPGVGTGPYAPVPEVANELRANPNYYLGKPVISRITLQTFPSFRSAWAEMLRNQTDVLYEVGVDALDSLRNATAVAHVFTYLRRYQYVIVLNTDKPALKPKEVRQALNLAIDRESLVREALDGHGKPSTGPVAEGHWSNAGRTMPLLKFDPVKATDLVSSRRTPTKFTCLVVPDYERLALVAKRQLQAIGVEMTLESVRADEFAERMSRRDYDAFLTDAISGPTMFRLYRLWHSGAPLNTAGIGNSDVDAALDAIRYAASDDEYRSGVFQFQRTMLDNPPAIFLAWSEGARVVSSRFDAPTDPERPDPIATLRMWRPAVAHTARN